MLNSDENFMGWIVVKKKERRFKLTEKAHCLINKMLPFIEENK